MRYSYTTPILVSTRVAACFFPLLSRFPFSSHRCVREEEKREKRDGERKNIFNQGDHLASFPLWLPVDAFLAFVSRFSSLYRIIEAVGNRSPLYFTANFTSYRSDSEIAYTVVRDPSKRACENTGGRGAQFYFSTIPSVPVYGRL